VDTDFDVVIVGAGISGIGAAHHLREQCVGTSFVVLESKATFGGTWHTHTYPGVRSDSDLFTFGYRFKPWVGAPIASGVEILRYLEETIQESDLASHIRYHHRIVAAQWSSTSQQWSLDVARSDTDELVTFTTRFLWMCQGYYHHAKGYTPEWEGMERFEGDIVHPQNWPTGYDCSNKKVVVIGSGATAATLIPALVDEVEHITMLQRSPTFFIVRPNTNEVADMLRQLEIPDEWTHEIVRRKIVQDHEMISSFAREYPEMAREFLINEIRALLPEGFDVHKHFNPAYRPWQQRIAVLPDGDLFAGIRSGKASVVTDEIETFTESGLRLKSGETLSADVVITATGFDLSVLGDVSFTVDGTPFDAADAVTYRGIMFTGLPNLAYVFGYFRASWTLRADLISDFVCRVLNHLDELGVSSVVPALTEREADMTLGPWVDPDNFNPGYLTRSMHLMPKQGSRMPWRLPHEYLVEKVELPGTDLDDGCLVYK
jgi:monooxygenase